MRWKKEDVALCRPGGNKRRDSFSEPRRGDSCFILILLLIAPNRMQSLRTAALFLLFGLVAGAANAQIQVQLKFSRLQYIAYEPLLATVTITNRAGRNIDLNNDAGERWFGFEIRQRWPIDRRRFVTENGTAPHRGGPDRYPKN